jgi:hypothetical protein
VQAAAHLTLAAASLVVQRLPCPPMSSPANMACMLLDKFNWSLVQSTNWRNAAILDYVDYVLRPESALTDQEKDDLRKLLKLGEVTSMSKNKVDAVCTALRSSALWRDRPCKLTAEALEWLRAKQEELDERSAETQVAGDAPFALQFNKCTTPNERGPLALGVEHYTIHEIFMKSRCGPLMETAQQFARFASAHASAGMDCAMLLEGGLGSTEDSI